MSAPASGERTHAHAGVHFVGRHLERLWPDLAQLEERDVTLQAERFRGGLNNWIIQTYLHLKGPLAERGIPVSISERLVPGAVNVAHRDSLNRWLTPYYRSFIVGVRADRPQIFLCDWEVLQNQVRPCSRAQSAIPLWPQPGLVPRSPDRGRVIERIAYFGRTGTAARWLTDPAFLEALARLGVRFEIREDQWFDYSTVDLLLAHRKEAPVMLQHKPASKLVNAWHAGVPALLADEPAYRSLRRTDLDYLAVDSADDVLSAVRRLQSDPVLYHAMVHNGRVRAVDFTVEQIVQLWLDCLLDHVLPAAAALPARPAVLGWPLQLRRILRQKAESQRFKLRYARERADLERAG